MGFSSNIAVVLASLSAKAAKVDQAVENAANKGKVIGVQEIQILTPVDTSNLKMGYERATTITKPSDGVREITFTSDAPYQPFVELGTSRMSAKPHLRPGIHNATPAIGKILKEELEKV
jgi:HK97 gp10 family phage protein